MVPKTSCFHKARWVVMDSDTIIENGFIQTSGRTVIDMGTGKPPADEMVFDHGCGAIVPSLVNAHTHLELCSLKDRLSFESGFRAWVARLLEERARLSRKEIIDAAKEGIREINMAGSELIGEISTLGLTRKIFSESTIAGVWFQECLGNYNPQDCQKIESVFDKTKKKEMPHTYQACSLAVHGPHTTSPGLIKNIVSLGEANGFPVSIHLAESRDEMEFISTGKGAWADFLAFRGIRFSNWGIPAKSPVAYLEKIGALSDKLLAVHAIHCSAGDIKTLAKARVNICLCPRSNKNLHGQLPNIVGMLESGLNLCLGTDSLASCRTLSIFDEMKFLAGNFESIPPETIFSMATKNGARALGFEDQFGSLEPGKSASMVYVPIDCKNKNTVLEHIVNGNFINPPEMIFKS